MFKWPIPIRKSVSIRFRFDGEDNLHQIPEEIETKEAISNCLTHAFKDFKYCCHPKLEILVEGSYMDYRFKAIAHSKKLQKRVDAILDQLNKKLASI